jgi:hypothetical protein
MIIKSDKEFRAYQAAMETITQRGTSLGDMELLSDKDKTEYIRLAKAIHEWEAAYHPLPGHASTLCAEDKKMKAQTVCLPSVDVPCDVISYAF